MTTSPFHIGTSGWSYNNWKGHFYPSHLSSRDFLSYYAERLPAVEVNATFYRYPTENMISAWNRTLSPEYSLVVKGSQFITHYAKLKDCEEKVDNFLESVEDLNPLEAILWQLPPSLKKDLDRLETFLQLLPSKWKQAIEFRHPSWWHQDTVDLLSQYGAAFVAISHPQLPHTLYTTGADFVYLRFHGREEKLYHYDYSEKELKEWKEKLSENQKDQEVYAFFNNTASGDAPFNAQTFLSLLQRP